MDTLERLTELFRRFPGIGPRQARRFVYFLLTQDKNFVKTLAQGVLELKDSMRQCAKCLRFIPSEEGTSQKNICSLCLDPNRDTGLLLVVEKDIDLENIRRSGIYEGRFFVLGGLLPILEREPEKQIRIKELIERINKETSLKEIIVALSANPAGDHTLAFLKEKLSPELAKKGVKISVLGRGLSTGTEIEYLDAETIKSALNNRG